MPDDISVVPGLEGEPNFDEPWQAQAFAMTVALHEGGAFAWGEWAAILSDELTREPNYWTAWLHALEAMLACKDIAAAEVVDARTHEWRAAADATPHGEPIVLSR